MKRFFTGAILIILAILGAARFADFVRFTSLETGFFTQGSAFVRYIALGGGLLLCAIPLLFKRKQASPTAFCGYGLWFVCAEGLMCEILGVFYILQAVIGEFSVFRLCQGILFTALGLWCFYSAVFALKVKQAPRRGALIAALGGIAIYLTVLERFLVSPSSLHRMWPILDILSLISALLLYATIYKAVYTKNDARPYKRLAVFGLTTFFLSSCVQAPCAVYLFTQNAIHINDFAVAIILAVFGIIGAVAAQQAIAD